MSNRKLQSEIDRVLKKVSEGSTEFDQTIEKVYSASSQNQKEKHEADLKREIKKLQRYRDQIKTWLTFSDKDIKDKKALFDARKTIERQMERFRGCEKETKTKAYSKEGLQKQTARKDGKKHTRTWLQTSIDQLSSQLKVFETELKGLEDTGDQTGLERIISLEHGIERHRVHMEHLKYMQGAYENDSISEDQISKIKDAVDDYISNNQDPDYYEDEEIYTEADIHVSNEFEEFSDSGSNSDDDDEPYSRSASTSPRVERNADKKPEKKEPEPTPEPVKPTPQPQPTQQREENKRQPQKQAVEKPEPVERPAPPQNNNNSHSNTQLNDKNFPPITKSIAAPQNNVKNNNNNNIDRILPSQEKDEKVTDRRDENDKLNSAAAVISRPVPVTNNTQKQTSAQSEESKQANNPAGRAGASGPATPIDNSKMRKYQQIQQISGIANSPTKSTPQPASPIKSLEDDSKNIETFEANGYTLPIGSLEEISASTQAQDFSQAPKAPQPTIDPTGRTALTKQQKLSFLEQSYRTFKPKIIESTPYIPTNPAPTPNYYPSTPLTVFDNPEIYEKFDTDTLFFIFYYVQRQPQQYWAAKELKARSWRFHSKYLTWFQRHEEPKEITPEFEKGTYIYFDYESGWCQRKKTEFTFTYEYLEDH